MKKQPAMTRKSAATRRGSAARLILSYVMISVGLYLGWLTLFHPGFLPEVKPKVPIEDLTVEEFLKLSSTDLNTASQQELMSLPGIGEVLSQRIIEYREEHGGFSSVEELTEVKGIGEKTLEKLRKYVYVE